MAYDLNERLFQFFVRCLQYLKSLTNTRRNIIELDISEQKVQHLHAQTTRNRKLVFPKLILIRSEYH